MDAVCGGADVTRVLYIQGRKFEIDVANKMLTVYARPDEVKAGSGADCGTLTFSALFDAMQAYGMTGTVSVLRDKYCSIYASNMDDIWRAYVHIFG
jgi:hypothetical protein